MNVCSQFVVYNVFSRYVLISWNNKKSLPLGNPLGTWGILMPNSIQPFVHYSHSFIGTR